MADYKIGQTTWEEDDVVVQGGKFEKAKPMPLLRMENGKQYTVRIISKPYRYYAKWVIIASGKKIKLNSALTPDCPLCQDPADQPKLARYIRALYRSPDGKTEYKILDIGVQIYNGIKKIQNIPAYGKDVTKYDITIDKGAQGAQPLYTVQALPPTPMTPEDLAIAKKYSVEKNGDTPNPDYISLEERCKPLPVETIRKIIASTGEKSDKSSKAAKASADPEAGVFEEPESTPAPAPIKAAAAPKAASPAASAPGKTESGFLDF